MISFSRTRVRRQSLGMQHVDDHIPAIYATEDLRVHTENSKRYLFTRHSGKNMPQELSVLEKRRGIIIEQFDLNTQNMMAIQIDNNGRINHSLKCVNERRYSGKPTKEQKIQLIQQAADFMTTVKPRMAFVKNLSDMDYRAQSYQPVTASLAHIGSVLRLAKVRMDII